ncbi:MAG: DUF1036 domain-containing protein [Thermoanaerobaculia bacterium]|nr:DUF1036 domain-containing protein [Thermoanaerobaculia bacterium]
MTVPETPPALRRIRAGCLVFVVIGGVFFFQWLAKRFQEPSWDTATENTAAEPDPVRQQQEALVEEQVQAAREQTRRLYDERIELRRQKIQLISERLEKDGRREFDKILLVNQCPHEIAVAINYLDLDDKWIVRGWWNLKAGEETTTDAMTKNAKIYFYAENIPSGWKFDGSNRPGSRMLPVVDERFDYLEGETNLYPNPRNVSFYLVETGTTWTEHREVFACQAEASLPQNQP